MDRILQLMNPIAFTQKLIERNALLEAHMSRPQKLITGLAALVAISFLSCVEQDPVEEPLDPMATSPSRDISKLLDNGVPYTITYPKRHRLDNENIIDMPDGIHLRPGVKIHELTVEEAEFVYQNGDDFSLFHATGAAKEALKTADKHDVVFVDDGVAFIVNEVRRDVDETVFVTRPFNLVDVIYGNFRIEYEVPYQLFDNETGEYLVPDGQVTEETVVLDPTEDDPYATRKSAVTLWSYQNIPLTLELGRDVGSSGSIAAKLTSTLTLRATATVKGVFEGQISYINQSYRCKNPDEVGWFEGTTFCVDRLAAYFEAGAGGKIDATLEAEGKLAKGASTYRNGRERWSAGPYGVPLGTTGLALSLEPYMRVGGEINATAAGSVAFDWEANPRLPIGFEYINNSRYQRLPGNPSDGVYPIPNARYPKSMGNAGFNFKDATGDITVGAEAFIRGGIKFGAQNVGTRVISLTGADIYLSFKGTGTWRLLQAPGTNKPCLEFGFSTTINAEPSILFTVDAKVKSWSFNIFCSEGGDACAKLTSPNLTPNWKWSRNSAPFCKTGERDTVTLTPTSNTPAGRFDITGYEVDGLALTSAATAGAGSFSSRTTYATNGPSKARGRPDANCNNLSSKVAGITSSTAFKFGRGLKTGDTITVVQINDKSDGCRGSGTVRVSLSGNSVDSVDIGTIAQNGSIQVP